MTFKVTPFCMNDKLLRRDPLAMMARETKHTVHVLADYDERQTIDADVTDAHAACEIAWQTFQNVDENWQTPDGGRSLMVGDMVRVTDGAGNATWWICCSLGWTETLAPNDTDMQVVER